jgi:hypothetical protein
MHGENPACKPGFLLWKTTRSFVHRIVDPRIPGETGEFMKFRNLMLAALGMVFLAGSVLPAHADYRHHHRRHHRHYRHHR